MTISSTQISSTPTASVQQSSIPDAARRGNVQSPSPTFSRGCFAPVSQIARRVWSHIWEPALTPLRQRTMEEMLESDNANWFHGVSPFAQELQGHGDRQVKSSEEVGKAGDHYRMVGAKRSW